MKKDSTVLETNTMVWWDLDACPPPEDCDCHFISSSIKLALKVWVSVPTPASLHTATKTSLMDMPSKASGAALQALYTSPKVVQ
ncbi:hypothetical protein OROMI_005581 [Orobanche minor]